MKANRSHLRLSSPEVVPVTHDEAGEQLITVHVDLDELTYRQFIEPADDQVLHVYSTPRDNMVATGDIVFRRLGSEQARFYDVIYATTLRYPAPVCTKVCSRLPYQLFLQLEQIIDPSRLHSLLTDLKEQDALPF